MGHLFEIVHVKYLTWEEAEESIVGPKIGYQVCAYGWASFACQQDLLSLCLHSWASIIFFPLTSPDLPLGLLARVPLVPRTQV